MFGRKGKQKSYPDLVQDDKVDHEYSQPVPYWRGNIVYTWYKRLNDFLKLWFKGDRAIMVIRIRKDRRQDHMVFIPKTKQQNTINWGNETYDIEEQAIIRDNGKTVMYVVEGCRKPIMMSSWFLVCEGVAGDANAKLDKDSLKQFGKVSISSRDAFTKMNNRDAEILMRAGQNKYSEYAFYCSAIAALTGIILVCMMLGIVPSGVYGILEGFQQIFLVNREAIMGSLGV